MGIQPVAIIKLTMNMRTNNTIDRTKTVAARNRDWKAWNLMKRSLLKGSATRKMIGGMIVKYASAHATLEGRPPDPAALGALGGAAGGGATAATGEPHDPQKT